MLEFVQKPPKGPEEVSLSETGKVVLESRLNWNQLEALGRGACSELVDSFGEAGPPRDSEGKIVLAETTGFLLTEAAELLSDSSLHAFVNGIERLRLDLSVVPA
jgi:hypothetical protein